MELFGIVCSVPAAFVATAAYSQLVKWLLRWELLREPVVWASLVVLSGLMAEWVLLVVFGAVRIQALSGGAFYPIHLALFVAAVPAVANLMIIKGTGTVIGSWFVVALLCALFTLPVVLTQYGVSEALYGIE
jgi:hypothetical protein